MKRSIFLILVISLLFFTRLINLSWSLPYPMHPDERNMATAIQNLNCFNQKIEIDQANKSFIDCLNPHFFAYGQWPLYFGYGLIILYQWLKGILGEMINYEQAVLSLRLISATASIINAWVLVKIINLISKKKSADDLIAFLVIIFSPFFIQFSHFGTTESLLMLFYTLIIYLNLRLIKNQITLVAFIFFSALITGLAMATKISSAIFLLIPFTAFIYLLARPAILLKKKITAAEKKFFFLEILFAFLKFLLLTIIFFIIFSPYNFIDWPDFLSALKYESDVALGNYVVFYTRQFVDTWPVLFQFEKIFPYALGRLSTILFLLGFFCLSWKNSQINFLRLAFIFYFIPTAFMFAKWTRFMAPVMPVMIAFNLLFLKKITVGRWFKNLILIFLVLPGLAYLSIYWHPDVRFTASDWIFKNIPQQARILSETANVVDIPIQNPLVKNNGLPPNYQYVSFNFYDLDVNQSLEASLGNLLNQADYIFVPSRRIFFNHTCFNEKLILLPGFNLAKRCENLKKSYPKLNDYYQKLFSGELGFVKIAEFTSFPRLCLPFNLGCFNFNDEPAEETWTVFDHPVIRIFKKSSHI
ncbi:MAG: hypothetical protein QHH09_01715 [Microgenomates group bacterium]|nr:hypothetical protein [Microgenomates group bacterium]